MSQHARFLDALNAACRMAKTDAKVARLLPALLFLAWVAPRYEHGWGRSVRKLKKRHNRAEKAALKALERMGVWP